MTLIPDFLVQKKTSASNVDGRENICWYNDPDDIQAIKFRFDSVCSGSNLNWSQYVKPFKKPVMCIRQWGQPKLLLISDVGPEPKKVRGKNKSLIVHALSTFKSL
ncbi:hypothetical protein V2J09_023803 [Rumex salicifolius]